MEVPQFQFIDRVLVFPVVTQRRVPTVQTAQQNAEIHWCGVRWSLATLTDHSALRGQKTARAGEVEEQVTHATPRRQKALPPGLRPGVLTSPDARRAAEINDRLEHQHENSQRFLGRDGQDGRMRGMRKPRRQEHSVTCHNWQEEWKTRTIPQPERATRDTDAESNRTPRHPSPVPQLTHQ